MNPYEIIEKYYDKNSLAYKILIKHSENVTKKALEIAEANKHLNPDLVFIKEAAMLHDIGIFLTDSPGLGCFGQERYICHGFLGREVLEKEGYPKHGLVCERHIGLGITLEEIEREKLPLPRREMVPISVEEEIICFADKFFSKNKDRLDKEKTLEEVKRKAHKYGDDKKVEEWAKKFSIR